MGVLVSVGLLAWAFRGVRFAEVVDHVRRAEPGPILLTLGLALLVFPLRTLRWRLMVRDSSGRPADLRATWHGIAIGYMANALLPLRAGEVVRSFVLARLARVSLAGALASVAVERVFDALTVVGLVAAVLLAGAVPAGLQVGGLPVDDLVRRIALLGLGVLGLSALIFFRLRRIAAWLQRRGGRLSARLAGVLEEVWEHLAVFRAPGRLPWLGLYSSAVWLTNAASLYTLFPGFGIEVSFAGALVLQVALVFGVALPSSPGFVGVYEAAVVFALGLYGVAPDRALAYALVSHLLAFVPITVLGWYSLARTPIAWRTVAGAKFSVLGSKL